MSKTSSFNTKRRKDNKKAAAAAPLAASKTDDVNDATKTTTTVPKRPNNKKATPTLTFQEKIAKAHAEKNAKRQKQMFLDVVLSKEFGTYFKRREKGVFRSRDDICGNNGAFFSYFVQRPMLR